MNKYSIYENIRAVCFKELIFFNKRGPIKKYFYFRFISIVFTSLTFSKMLIDS